MSVDTFINRIRNITSTIPSINVMLKESNKCHDYFF